ncbi:MAG TPA: energy-coupling factor transporter transmembrane component T [Candidatus Nitrosotenuis sp.]|jgi:energy-coupling factor transport system permease protein|nr:energy-coupling factor transporter transmembrane component T [Candidatus Nitrosotenuis sp.]
MDPRARLILLALSFLPPLLFSHPLWTGSTALLLGTLALILGAGRALRRALPFLLTLVGASMLLWPLLLPRGEELARWGPLVLRQESLLYGVGMGFRLAAFTVAGLTFVALTPAYQVAWGLHGLGLPYPVAFGLSMSVRLAEQLVQTTVTVSQAQRARGLDPDSGSPLQRLRKYIPMMVPILVVSLRRVEGMSMAMESRAFGAGKRTSWLQYRWGWRESAAVLAAAAVDAGCAWVRLQGHGGVPGF